MLEAIPRGSSVWWLTGFGSISPSSFNHVRDLTLFTSSLVAILPDYQIKSRGVLSIVEGMSGWIVVFSGRAGFGPLGFDQCACPALPAGASGDTVC